MDAQSHLLVCPTLIQISSLIALPLHERLQFGPHDSWRTISLANLVLRHEQDLQQIARQDTFLLFLAPSPERGVTVLQS